MQTETTTEPSDGIPLAPKPVFTFEQIVYQLRASRDPTFTWSWQDTLTFILPMTPYSGEWVPEPFEASGAFGLTGGFASAARAAFALLDDVIAVSIAETLATDDAQIQVMYSSTTVDDGTYARTWRDTPATGEVYPGVSDYAIARSEVWFGFSASWYTHDEPTDVFRDGHPVYGGYGFKTYIHEFGHALGLSHPGLYDAGSGELLSYETSAEFAQDTRKYTLMSYWDADEDGSGTDHRDADGTLRYASTPLLYDVAALQAMYGADWSTRSGDTVYGFNSTADRSVFDFTINTDPIVCLWDGGGLDTLDLSGFSTDQVISLVDGTFSDVGFMTGNLSIAFGAIIENAVGGSGHDLIVGNGVGNEILGGAGDDTINGGSGDDTARYAGARDRYEVSFDSPSRQWIVRRLPGGASLPGANDGTDRLLDVEWLAFSDQRIRLGSTTDREATGVLNVSGTPEEGGTLRASLTGVVDGDGAATIGYRWQQDTGTPSSPLWMDIAGATGATLSIPSDQSFVGRIVRVVATTTDVLGGTTAFEGSPLTIANVNDVPTLALPIADRNAIADTRFEFALPSGTFVDEDGDPLTLSAALSDGGALPGWLNFSATTNTFSGTPTIAEVGAIDVTVIATDPSLASARETFRITIDTDEHPPIVANPIPDRTATQGVPFSMRFSSNTFVDYDEGDRLSYAARQSDGRALPGWLTFVPSTRTFRGTPTNDAVGTLNITVTATDLKNATASDSFEIVIANVNDAPILSNPIPDQTADEDAPFRFTLPGTTFSEIDVGDRLAFTATLEDDGPLPGWLAFDAESQTFSGTPTDEELGAIDVTVTATDLDGAFVSDDFRITVRNTNDAPTLVEPLSDREATQGVPFTVQVPSTTFSDIDQGDTLRLSAGLADGSPLPSWLAFDSGKGTLAGTPGNADVGSLTVVITATDNAGASASDAFTIVVANVNDAPILAHPIPDQATDEDTLFALRVSDDAFADIDPGDALRFAATLADASPLPEWLAFDPGTRGFTGTPTNDDVGALDLTVTATDLDGASASGTFRITVRNVNDAPTLAHPIPDQATNEDTAFAFQLADDTFADVDPDDVLSWSAMRADGTPLPDWLAFDPGTGSFTGIPTNDDVGALEVTVTATDLDSASASGTFRITVRNVNDAPTLAHPIPDQTTDEDTDFAFQLSDDTFADADPDDVLTWSATRADGTPLPDWLAFDPGTRSFTGTPTNDDVDALDLTVTATDLDSASASSTFRITVRNANDAPTLAQPIADRTTDEDAVFTFQVSDDTFADVDPDDLLSWSATRADGTPLPGWLAFDPATRGFTGTPGNGDVGAVDLTVTATDLAGASASGTLRITVRNVNDAPTLAHPIPDQAADEDALFAFEVSDDGFADVDPDDALTWSATRADGTPLPDWLAFDASTRSFTGTPTNDDVGALDLTVTATDLEGASASSTFRITVRNVNDAPTLAQPIADRTTDEDAVFAFQPSDDAFADVDPDDVLSWSATRADGTPLPDWLAFDPDTRSFAGTPGNDDVGALDLTVTTTDLAVASAAGTFRITVRNVNDAPTLSHPIPDQATNEDTLFAFQLSDDTFADVDPDDVLTWSSTRADGTRLPDWLAFDPDTRSFAGTPGNDDVGALDVKVTTSDLGGASASDTFSIAVANVNDAPTGTVTITGTPTAGRALIASNTLTDPDGLGEISYEWQADGAPITGGSDIDGATLMLDDAHVGSVISVRAVYVDDGGAMESVASAETAAVAARPLTIEGTAGSDPALTGGGGDDTINGFGGSDTLTGAGGNDLLDGGYGLSNERDLAVYTGPIAGYTLSRTGPTLTIADATPGRDGTDTTVNLERLLFSDVGVNLTVQATAASIDQDSLDRLCELYLGFFARVPAADGLENWVSQFKGGKSLNRIADDFYGIGSGEALRSVTGYWDFANNLPLSDTDFVRIAYRNVLGREGLEGGINYWATQLSGPEAKTRGELVGTMLDAARGLTGDATWGWVAELLDDKVTMSKRVALDWGLNYGANAAEAIAKGVAIANATDEFPNPNPTYSAIPVKTFDFDAATALIGVNPGNIDLIA